MAMHFRKDATKDTEFAPVPNGEYDVVVDKCEEADKPDKNGDAYFRATLKIVGPTHAGRLLFANYIGTMGVEHFARSCGVELPDEGDIEARQFVRKLARVRTEVETWNGKDSAKVAAWLPPHKDGTAPTPALAPKLEPMPPFEQETTLDDIPF